LGKLHIVNVGVQGKWTCKWQTAYCQCRCTREMDM